jgi:hypothetical protein
MGSSDSEAKVFEEVDPINSVLATPVVVGATNKRIWSLLESQLSRRKTPPAIYYYYLSVLAILLQLGHVTHSIFDFVPHM